MCESMACESSYIFKKLENDTYIIRIARGAFSKIRIHDLDYPLAFFFFS